MIFCFVLFNFFDKLLKFIPLYCKEVVLGIVINSPLKIGRFRSETDAIIFIKNYLMNV
jgi:hypothetical protein